MPFRSSTESFERFKTRVFSESIVPDRFHPRRACCEPNLDDSKTLIKRVAIKEQEAHDKYVSREAYAIHVPLDDMTITIRTLAPRGALPVSDSLAQLFYAPSR